MDLRAQKVCVDRTLCGGSRIGILYLETGSVYRPSHVYYDRANSSFAEICPGMINWRDIFKEAGWFHWTGITPALSQNAADTLKEAIQMANELGITVSCDINYRGNLWQYGKKASEVMPELITGSDIILGNEEDCEKVFGIKPDNFDVENTSGHIDSAIFISVCSQMMKMFPRCKKMVVTLRGSINANYNTWAGILYDGKTLYRSQQYDITHIVDRVGGGDSFMGALIYGLINYPNDNQKVLDFATAASCLKHTIKGDFNLVTKEEVEALMSGAISGRVKR